MENDIFVDEHITSSVWLAILARGEGGGRSGPEDTPGRRPGGPEAAKAHWQVPPSCGLVAIGAD